MLLLLISVSLVNLIVSPVYGLVGIESQPAKVANGNYLQLVCDVGTMENNVKWVYGGVTYFSCDPPYTNCFTNTSVTNDGYDFSINDDSLTMILLLSQNLNDGIWSCFHGNEEADIDIDNADAPKIIHFSSNYSGGEKENDVIRSTSGDLFQFQCKTESQVPADVVIYSQNYLGIRKLYEMNQTMITDHSITSRVLCEDYIIVCNVSNGYGPTISKYRYTNKDCPLKILDKLSTNILKFDQAMIGTEVKLLKVYFEGGSDPSQSLHYFTTNGFQEVLSEASLTQYPQPYPYEPPHVVIAFRHIQASEAGKYVFTLKSGLKNGLTPTVVKLFIINLVYTGEATTGGSDQPPPTTTTTNGSPTMADAPSSGGMLVGKTKAETMIMVCMVYLGLSVYFGSME